MSGSTYSDTFLQNGALELEGGELSFDAGPDGKPRRVEGKVHLPMMSVVAEMMIFANAAVAHRIAEAFPGAALLRRHPAPRPEAFEPVCYSSSFCMYKVFCQWEVSTHGRHVWCLVYH